MVAVAAGWLSWKQVAYSVVQRCTDTPTHTDEVFFFLWLIFERFATLM